MIELITYSNSLKYIHTFPAKYPMLKYGLRIMHRYINPRPDVCGE